ncbi:MAG: alpha-ketoacid dehydrogenase subunit beta [Nitrospinota bacterium]
MSSDLSYLEALIAAKCEAMRADSTVVVLGEDVGPYGGTFGLTRGLFEEFGPRRVIDTPISEAGFTGAAVGAALTGLRPIVELKFIDFTLVAMDQLVNQAAKLHFMLGGQGRMPVVFMVAIGVTRGAAAQHSQSLHAWFVHAPGLKVVMPSTPYDAKGLLASAIDDDGPVLLVAHKLLFARRGPVPEGSYRLPFGRAALRRKGADVTVVATSIMVGRALEAAEALATEGVEAEVIDPKTLVPLDLESILASVRKTGRLVVADEGHLPCGVGAEVAALVQREAFDYLDAPVERVGAPAVPVPFSEPLEAAYTPGAEDIRAAVRRTLGGP